MKYLRAVEPEDLELMYLVENDPMVVAHSVTSVPLSRYALKQYIEQCRGDLYADAQVRLTIMNPDNGQPCGFLDLTDFMPRHRRAQVGIVLLPEAQGRGVATEVLREVGEYARLQGLHQLYAVVMSTNSRARSLFQRAGYNEIACLPEWLLSDDRYVDAILFQTILSQ